METNCYNGDLRIVILSQKTAFPYKLPDQDKRRLYDMTHLGYEMSDNDESYVTMTTRQMLQGL